MKRNNILTAGCVVLSLFCVTTLIAIIILLLGITKAVEFPWFEGYTVWNWVGTIALVVLAEAVVFWTGIAMVYLTSVQLGIRYRTLGILCGWIPIANLIMLAIIIKTCWAEARFERRKMKMNRLRAAEKVCQTKYPILMVHGVFFRDYKHFNYWGRIPEELQKNGATIFYGNHNSAAAVDDSAKELETRILEIVKQTGCEKVNVIAHSKGGLDMRTALAKTGAAKYVASLATINTPHRGCEFADYLLEKIPKKQQEMAAKIYNASAEKLGDHNPDFISAVYDLTFANCAKRNEEVQDVPGIFYQSFGSKLSRPTSGRFPLNMTYGLVKLFDGANDGLVGENSFAWGENYKMLTASGTRGISHGDVIDLNRENIKGFDVREFYVQLVADLKKRGL